MAERIPPKSGVKPQDIQPESKKIPEIKKEERDEFKKPKEEKSIVLKDVTAHLEKITEPRAEKALSVDQKELGFEISRLKNQLSFEVLIDQKTEDLREFQKPLAKAYDQLSAGSLWNPMNLARAIFTTGPRKDAADLVNMVETAIDIREQNAANLYESKVVVTAIDLRKQNADEFSRWNGWESWEKIPSMA